MKCRECGGKLLLIIETNNIEKYDIDENGNAIEESKCTQIIKSKYYECEECGSEFNIKE